MNDPPSSRSGSRPPGMWEPPSLEMMQGLLPQYEFISLLGRGGMGAVYKARQISLDRMVAIKVLPGDLLDDAETNFMERFKQEARTMARMNHPAIVSVYDFGQTQDGLLYFVMEFVDGTDVSQMIVSQRRLAADHALAITAHVCDALAYAHGHGIVHRDIKPANVLINMKGQVKVADFGLAKANDGAEGGLTKSNVAMGTPDFVAPEALIPGMPLDGRADLYAVGVMLYQMLTGEIPRGLWQMPSLKVGADNRFDAIIAKAMQTDREMRYQSSREIRQDLDLILAMPVVQAGGQSSAAIPQQVVAAQRPVAQSPQAPNPRQDQDALQPSQPPHKKRRSGIGMALGFGAAALVILGLVVNASRKTEEKAAAGLPGGPSNPDIRPTEAALPKESAPKPRSPSMERRDSKVATPSFTAPAPILGSQAVEVLPLSNLAKYLVEGEWRPVAESLVLENSSGRGSPRIVLPQSCSGSYLLETEFTPAEATGDFVLHLPLGRVIDERSAVSACLRLDKDGFAGFETLNGKSVDTADNPVTFRKLDIRKGEKQRLLVRVEIKPGKKVSLGLWLNARPLAGWEGQVRDITGFAAGWAPKTTAKAALRIAVGTNCTGLAIHRIRIQALDGELRSDEPSSVGLASHAPLPAPAPDPAVTAIPAVVADPVSLRLKDVEKQFLDAYEKQVGTVHQTALADLNQKYVSALDRAIATASQASNLDDALALRDEKELIQAGHAIPAEDAASVPASLKAFRDTYRKALAALVANRDNLATPLYAAYDKALANYQDELTRAARLDEAQRVKGVRDHVASRRDAGSSSAPASEPPAGGFAAMKPAQAIIPVAPPLSADKILPPVSKASPEEVRELLNWCLDLKKGSVRILDNGITREVKRSADLPKGKFSLVNFYIYEVPMDEEGKQRMAMLGRIPEVESIFFHKNPGAFPVEALRGLTKLRDLHLTPTAVDDAAFAHLTGLKSLEKLAITYFCDKFEGTGLGYINENLQEFETDSKTLSAEGLAYLPRFKRLKRLVLKDCTGITDSMLHGLAELPELVELDVSHTHLDGSFLAHFPPGAKLQRLALGEMQKFKPQHLKLLARLAELQSLTLPSLDLSSDDMAAVAALPKLAVLQIEDAPFTGEGFAVTKGFNNLHSLKLLRCPVTAKGWAAIGTALPRLEALSFGRYTGNNAGTITADALGMHLSKLRNLTKLTFSYSGIDDSWLKAIPPLRNLTEVNLSGTAITDAAVPILATLPKLEKVSAGGTKLTEAGKAEVQKMLRK